MFLVLNGIFDSLYIMFNVQIDYFLTSTTKVVLEAQWGICSAPCVLRQYTVVFA